MLYISYRPGQTPTGLGPVPSVESNIGLSIFQISGINP